MAPEDVKEPTTEKQPPPKGVGRRVAGAKSRGESVARKAREWTERQEPTSRQGVVIDAFKRYREAEGALYALVMTAYSLIALLPAVLLVSALLRSGPRAPANRLDSKLGLEGATSKLVHEVLRGAGQHKFIATVIAVASALISALGFGRAMQRVCVGAWRMPEPVNDTRNVIRCQIWFLVMFGGVLVIAIVNSVAASGPTWVTWALTLVWAGLGVLFFTWTPSVLLDRRVPRDDALPGGLVTAAGIAL